MKIFRMAGRDSQLYPVKIGQRYWFEYHCYEGHDSADAELWYHSHQQITVLKLIERGIGKTPNERGDNGHPAMYSVKFDDGFVADIFEDEIMNSQSDFFRPDPPKNPKISTREKP